MNRPLLCLFLLALAALACAGGASTPERAAWTACDMFVMDRYSLKQTLTANDYDPSYVSTLGAGQYRVRVFYSEYEKTFECVVTHSGDRWKLDSLTLLP